MAYVKTTWVDNVTPVSATNMSKIEQKLFDSDAAITLLGSKNKGFAITNPATPITLDQFIASLQLENGFFVVSAGAHTNITAVPGGLGDCMVTVSGGIAFGSSYYATLTCQSLTTSVVIYSGRIYNNTVFSGWVRVPDIATQSEVSLGTDTTKVITPVTLRGLSYATTVPSENLRASSDSIAQVSSNSVYVKKKAFTIVTPGTYRVKFDMQSSGTATAYAQIYKNGVAFGTVRSVSTSGYVTFTEDLVFAAGDTCEVWIKAVTTTAYVKNFRMYFDVAYSMNFNPSVSTPSVSYEIA